jgi:chaperonin cofactor prefoldin
MSRKNYSFTTLKWIEDELDKLHQQSISIGDMLMEETDLDLVKILDKKLNDIENKVKHLQIKMEFEKNNIY